MAMASIAHWDWPDAWPDFLNFILQAFQLDPSTNSILLKGAIRCLDIFVDGDNLSSEHLPRLMRDVLPPLWIVFNDAKVIQS
jgi:hypothetical protein